MDSKSQDQSAGLDSFSMQYRIQVFNEIFELRILDKGLPLFYKTFQRRSSVLCLNEENKNRIVLHIAVFRTNVINIPLSD